MVTSIYSTAAFLENPFRKQLIKEAMKAPNADLSELLQRAKNNQVRLANKVQLLFQKIWHHLKLFFSSDYKKSFNLAVKKIAPYKALDGSAKANMLTEIGKLSPRLQEAWSGLLSDCDQYIQSWSCSSSGNYTLELSKALNLRIPADKATLQFAQMVTGHLDSGAVQMSFDSGLTTAVDGVAGTPYIFWMSYTSNGDIISVRGGYADHWPLAKTQDNPAATLINNWKNHQIL